MDYVRARKGLRAPGKNTNSTGGVPVPVKGVNSIAALSQLGPEECMYAYNILPSEQGFRTRLGTIEWANTIDGIPRTVIAFQGNDPAYGDDKLFATGEDGIYDVTSSGIGAATLVYSFVTPGSDAGYGNYIIWNSASGDSYILYADSVNGLLVYNASTDTWAPSTITGVDPALVRYVKNHKLRIWLLVEDDPNGYYLPVDAFTGAATAFQLGSKFPHGGDAAGIFTFTHDGGNGPDDLFLAIGRGGDVVIYIGTDPSSASTWNNAGTWYVGAIPAGRKFASEFAGDVFILSANGISSAADLMESVDVTENFISVTGKITNLLRSRMQNEINDLGWELINYPSEGYIVIQSPQRIGNLDEWIHYCYHTTQKGWGFFRSVQSVSMAIWREKLYYAQADGTIWYMSGDRDQVKLNGDPSVGVEFSFLTGYSNAGAPGQMKIPSFVRPIFLAATVPEYAVKVLFDYDLYEPVGTGEPAPATGFLWDTALWDAALWGGINPYKAAFGSAGIGVALAVAVRGRASSRATLAEISAAWRTGGFL
jgi:hypothetical protein